MLAKFLLALLLCCIYSPQTAVSTETDGKIIVDLKNDFEPKMINYPMLYDEYLKEVELFDKKYPQQQINRDFSQDVFDMHPEYSDYWVDFKYKLLRWGVKGKRLYNSLKQKFEDFLIENDIPLQFDDSQYEMGETETYQESDKPIVIYKPKKVIAYSNQRKDQEAVKEKIYRDAKLLTPYERKQIMKKALLEKDWKTFFSYGLFDGNVFDDNSGIGDWFGPNDMAVRLVSEYKTIADDKQLNGLLQLFIKQDDFLLKNRFENYTPLRIDFSKSVNVKNVSFNWPFPINNKSANKKSFSGYANIVDIPFKAEIIDNKKPVLLIANISGTVCRDTNCHEENIEAELSIKIGDKTEQSNMALKVRLSKQFVPQEKNDNIKLKKIYTDVLDGKTVIVLDAWSKLPVTKLKIFVENDNLDNFETLQFNHNKNDLRIYLLSPLSKQELTGKNIKVALAIDDKNSIVENMTIYEKSDFNSIFDVWSIRNICGAWIGGLLLNIMPSLLTLWLFKLKSFCNFGGANPINVKKDLLFNVWGILSAIFLIYLAILGYRINGNIVGYGNIYQNKVLLCLEIFFILLIAAYANGILKLPKKHSEKTKNFVFGIITVGLALMYNLPYSANIIDVSINNGSIIQITVAIIIVTLGFITPYIIGIIWPEFVFYIPYPKRWFSKIDNLVNILLFIALFWIMIVLTSQTSWHLWWHWILFILACALVILAVFFCANKFNKYLEKKNKQEENKTEEISV